MCKEYDFTDGIKNPFTQHPKTDDGYASPPISERERVGRMLKGLRLRANLTQKELAKQIDVPQSHISQYESNSRPIPLAKAKELAKIFNSVESHFLMR